jgi:hypothetical protein
LVPPHEANYSGHIWRYLLPAPTLLERGEASSSKFGHKRSRFAVCKHVASERCCTSVASMLHGVASMLQGIASMSCGVARVMQACCAVLQGCCKHVAKCFGSDPAPLLGRLGCIQLISQALPTARMARVRMTAEEGLHSLVYFPVVRLDHEGCRLLRIIAECWRGWPKPI